MSEERILVISVRQEAADESDADNKFEAVKKALALFTGVKLSATYAAKIIGPSPAPHA